MLVNSRRIIISLSQSAPVTTERLEQRGVLHPFQQIGIVVQHGLWGTPALLREAILHV
jgi:hypothetical protein